MSEYSHQSGKKNGSFRSWFHNGRKKSVGNYIDGGYDGEIIEWYENGVKKEEGNFVNGNQNGKWTYYNKDGSIDGTEEY